MRSSRGVRRCWSVPGLILLMLWFWRRTARLIFMRRSTLFVPVVPRLSPARSLSEGPLHLVGPFLDGVDDDWVDGMVQEAEVFLRNHMEFQLYLEREGIE